MPLSRPVAALVLSVLAACGETPSRPQDPIGDSGAVDAAEPPPAAPDAATAEPLDDASLPDAGGMDAAVAPPDDASAPDAEVSEALGATALEPDPASSEAGGLLARYPSITPAPELATEDVPSAYTLDCQAGKADVSPTWCSTGDLASDVRVVLVGDSKILQYYDALDLVGKALGWRVLAATKSSCPFADVQIDRDGGPYVECDAFNANLLEQLARDPPFAVLTGQASRSAYAPGTRTSGSQDNMVQGLVRRWAEILALDTKVIVLLDNPRPPAGTSIFQCLLDHPEQHDQCAFERDAAIARSAAVVQRSAAELLPDVRVIDLTRWLCPRSECAPVIGGVLVYRLGSHITNTYAKTLAPRLQSELEAALR